MSGKDTAPRQLAFDLHLPATYREADFVISGANAAAVAQMQAEWPLGRLLLCGPEGAGKTHLAHVWANAMAAPVLGMAALLKSDPTSFGPDLVVEDADLAAGDAAAEEVLFHLINHMAATGGRMLLTARAAPRDWGAGVARPDQPVAGHRASPAGCAR